MTKPLIPSMRGLSVKNMPDNYTICGCSEAMLPCFDNVCILSALWNE